MQVATEAQAAAHYENPFDVTKTWSQKEFPLIEIGELELNRNRSTILRKWSRLRLAQAT